jgi:serine/threonine protein kinase
MTPVAGCPDAARLRAFVLGQLPAEDAADLDAHVPTCPACLQQMQLLEADDALSRTMRAAADLAARPLGDVEQGVLRQMQTVLQEQPALPVPPPEARPDPPAPPTESGPLGCLGPYRLLEEVGAGGMGVVYRAEDPQLRRTVAVKTIRDPQHASAAVRRRFLREARAAAAIDHDHIVSTYHVGEQDGVPFLAMPLLVGESLDHRQRREIRLPLAETLRIGREIALGLAAAHGRGLIHRDVKPANIWLEGERGRVKLLDFGLARVQEDPETPDSEAGDPRAETSVTLEALDATQHGTVVGTPAFMAPEQAAGEAIDERCDLFSLGCVLYLMATGRLPFGGQDAASEVVAVTVCEPVPLGRVDPSLPTAFVELVMRLLARDSAARPPSAQAVAEGLQALQTAPGPRVKRRRPLLAGMLVLTALALLGLAGFYWHSWLFPSEAGEPKVDPAPREEPQGEVFRHHWDAAFSHVALAPDGSMVAACAGNDVTRVWDVRSGKMVRSLCGYTAFFTHDAKHMLTISHPQNGNQLRLYSLESDAAPDEFGKHERDTWWLWMSPDGKTAVSRAADFTFRLWDLETYAEIHRWPTPGGDHDYTFIWSDDGRYVFYHTDRDTPFDVWDIAARKHVKQFDKIVNRNLIQVLAGGNLAREGDESKPGGFTINTLDVATGNVVDSQTLLFPEKQRRLCTAGNAGRNCSLVSFANGKLHLYDWLTGKELHTFEMKSRVNNLIISQDGRYAAGASNQGEIVVWRLPPSPKR